MDILTISVAKTIKVLGLGRTTVYNLIRSGELETVKIGNRRLVKVESIRRLIDHLTGKSDS
jgi:excisionase family DNA binding protein